MWADRSPLAHATVLLAELTSTALPSSGDLHQLASWYATEGYRVDDLALRALATAISTSDRQAVVSTLGVLYDPWVDDLARQFQKASTSTPGYRADTGLTIDPGTCVVYVDALRMDLGHRLAARLSSLSTRIDHRLTAFPSVTPTGQPSVLPIAKQWQGGAGFDAADSDGRSVKGSVLRGALASHGVQYLAWGESGDPTGTAWTQISDIDSQGHSHGHGLVAMLDHLISTVADRVTSLLDGGWRRLVVVTDHGFLLPAAPAAKVELPLLLTEGDASRKPRVARLKPGVARPSFPVLPWTWDTDVEMVSAPGASAFQAGTLYEHGGLSLQECVTPVLVVELAAVPAGAVHIESLKWTGLRCRIDVTPSAAEVTIEIRTQAGDPSTAVAGPKEPSGGEVRLLVDEARAAEGSPVHVVALDRLGTVIAQYPTTVGGTL